MKKLTLIGVMIFSAASFAGCGYLLAGGAGAAGGYVVRDQGYVVQNPITKEQKNQDTVEQKQKQDDKATTEKEETKKPSI